MQALSRVVRSPVLVLDVRDWYAETFLAPGAVVRPSEPVRVLATPVNPVGWPFRGEAELLTITSPLGFVIFFDGARALPADAVASDPYRAGDGPVLQVRLADGDYRLRLVCRGFQTFEGTAKLPMEGPTLASLLPGSQYPFPPGRRANGNSGPTLLRGGLVQTDGTAVPDVVVSVVGRPLIQPCSTDASGQWVLVLDPYNPDFPAAPTDPANDLTHKPVGPVTLLFATPPPVTLLNFPFEPGITTLVKWTSLRGAVQSADGLPVAGAAITVAGFDIRSASAGDGAWVYYFPLDGPPAAGQVVTVSAAGPSGAATKTVKVTAGATTRVPPITL
jgi:hypothetical protein